MEAARPTQTVDTFGRMCRIVSKTAIPAQEFLFGHQHVSLHVVLSSLSQTVHSW